MTAILRQGVMKWGSLTVGLVGLLMAQSAPAHVFKLYDGAFEEMNEWIEIHYAPTQFILRYTGEYHGQIAPHIRFMMDADQNERWSPQEVQQFIQDYQSGLASVLKHQQINLDNIGYVLTFQRCTFPELEQSQLIDPLTVTLEFRIDALRVNPNPISNNHLLEIQQQVLFQFGQHFIDMAQARAAFTDEQVNVIARLCRVTIQADERISFTRCYPGSISRDTHSIRGISYDDTSRRLQFSPYPKISATFVIQSPD